MYCLEQINYKSQFIMFLSHFSFSRDSWNKERSEKDELLKNTKLQHVQQQARAQDAEVRGLVYICSHVLQKSRSLFLSLKMIGTAKHSDASVHYVTREHVGLEARWAGD